MAHKIIQSGSEDTVQVRRVDLYALFDDLTLLHARLMPVWDPDATVHPLDDVRRASAGRALSKCIADVENWLEGAQAGSESA